MAKKIRLDFSKTEERSGWNTRHISEGIHKMKVDGVQETEAQDGTAMLVYALVPTDSKYKSRRFPYYCKLQQNQLWKLRDLFVAAGETIPKKALQIDPGKVVGRLVAAEVEDDTYQGNIRSQVQGTYGLDILDEDGDTVSDEDDEEYEGDEPEDDEYEDEEEVEDEEEEEEDLSDLSLAELRKRAKGLGIDTAGLKKTDLIDEIVDAEADAGDDEEEDEDEDDLGDEDLEDEELEDEEFEDDEDEEEEEEPAPKRRPASTRKAPAKAPAKATARRTVKRR
jgi:hypothetical protein